MAQAADCHDKAALQNKDSKASKHLCHEAASGKADLVSQQKQEKTRLKTGGKSGLSGIFGKPELVDSAKPKAEHTDFKTERSGLDAKGKSGVGRDINAGVAAEPGGLNLVQKHADTTNNERDKFTLASWLRTGSEAAQKLTELLKRFQDVHTSDGERKRLLKDLTERLDLNKKENKEERLAVFIALQGLRKYATEDQIKKLSEYSGKAGVESLRHSGLSEKEAQDIQRTALLSLASIMKEARGESVKKAAFDVLRNGVWPTESQHDGNVRIAKEVTDAIKQYLKEHPADAFPTGQQVKIIAPGADGRSPAGGGSASCADVLVVLSLTGTGSDLSKQLEELTKKVNDPSTSVAERQKMMRELTEQLDPKKSQSYTDRVMALATFMSVSKYANREQLEVLKNYSGNSGLDVLKTSGLSDKEAASIQSTAASGLANIIKNCDVPKLKELAFDALANGDWPMTKGAWGVNFIRGDVKDAMLKYVHDHPYDTERRTQAGKMFYDAKLTPTVAEILRGWGDKGSDKELREKAEKLVKAYEKYGGEQPIRDIANRIALYNSLPAALQKELTGTSGPIDPRQIEGQMLNGRLGQSSNKFLLEGPPQGKTLEQKLEEKLKSSTTESTERTKLLNETQQERKNCIDLLSKYVKEGNMVAQPYLLKTIANYDRLIRIQTEELRQLQLKQECFSLAKQSYQYQKLINGGDRKGADLLALEMLKQHDTKVLQSLTPAIWKELSEKGSGPAGRTLLDRLHDAGLTQFDKLADNGKLGDPDARFRGALDALKNLKVDYKQGTADVEQYRINAFRAIDGDPKLQALAGTAGELGQNLTDLLKMAQEGTAGWKSEEYTRVAKEKAKAVQEALAKVTPEQVQQVRDRIHDMKEALAKIPESEDASRRQLKERIEAMTKLVNVLDPKFSDRKELEELCKHVTGPDFQANTFGNWLKTKGPALVGAIVTAAAATALVVTTMGMASPLAVALVSVVAGSAGWVVGEQATNFFLHEINTHIGDTGLGDKSSHIVKWLTADPAQRNFCEQVLGPCGTEFAVNTGLALVTMGLVKGVQVGGQWVAQLASGETLTASQFQRLCMSRAGTQLEAQLERATALGTESPAVNKFLQEWMRHTVSLAGFTAAQNTAEYLTGANSYMAFGITIGLALAHSSIGSKLGERAIRRVDGNHFDLDPRVMKEVVEQCEKDGHKVTTKPDGTIEVEPYGGKPGEKFVLRPNADVANHSDKAPELGKEKEVKERLQNELKELVKDEQFKKYANSVEVLNKGLQEEVSGKQITKENVQDVTNKIEARLRALDADDPQVKDMQRFLEGIKKTTENGRPEIAAERLAEKINQVGQKANELNALRNNPVSVDPVKLVKESVLANDLKKLDFFKKEQWKGALADYESVENLTAERKENLVKLLHLSAEADVKSKGDLLAEFEKSLRADDRGKSFELLRQRLQQIKQDREALEAAGADRTKIQHLLDQFDKVWQEYSLNPNVGNMRKLPNGEGTILQERVRNKFTADGVMEPADGLKDLPVAQRKGVEKAIQDLDSAKNYRISVVRLPDGKVMVQAFDISNTKGNVKGMCVQIDSLGQRAQGGTDWTGELHYIWTRQANGHLVPVDVKFKISDSPFFEHNGVKYDNIQLNPMELKKQLSIPGFREAAANKIGIRPEDLEAWVESQRKKVGFNSYEDLKHWLEGQF